MSDDSWAQALAILQYLQSQTPYDGVWHIQTRGATGEWVILRAPPSTAAAAEEVAQLARTSTSDAEYLLVQAPRDGAPADQAGRLAFRGVRSR